MPKLPTSYKLVKAARNHKVRKTTARRFKLIVLHNMRAVLGYLHSQHALSCYIHVCFFPPFFRRPCIRDRLACLFIPLLPC